MQKNTMTTTSNDKILRQKETLAAAALQVAEDALELLQDHLEECSTRDLVTVFNSAVKAHREIVSDIVSLTETESKGEQDLAKEYGPTVEKLLNKLKPKSQKE
jgi:hypothetical protein